MKVLAVPVVAAAALACSVAGAEPAPSGPRDEDVASSLTILGSVGAVFLVGAAGNHTSAEWKPAAAELAGAVVAPAIGHIYAGDWLSPGLGMRVAGAGLLVLGAYNWSRPSGNSSQIELSPVGGMLIAGGLVSLATGVIYDIATSRRAVRRYNREHATIVPTALATATGVAPGLALAGGF